MNGVVLRGRSEAMSAALAVIRQVIRTGQGAGLVVTGEAGIGKSALVTAVVREAGRLGDPVRHGQDRQNRPDRPRGGRC